MKRICKQCGNDFIISNSEIAFYKQRKLSLPKRCKECREQNKHQKTPTETQNKEQEMQSETQNKQPKMQPETQKQSESQNKQPKMQSETRNKQPKMQSETQNRQAKSNQKKNTYNDSKYTETNKTVNAPVETKQTSSYDSLNSAAKKEQNPIRKWIYTAIAVIVILLVGTGGYQALQPKNDAAINDTARSQTTLYTFRNEELLQEHFEKHGIEMGFSDAESYVEAANEVVANSEVLHKVEAEDGDDVYYLEDSNEFVVISTDGYLRTYFCPEDGLDYFNRQ